MVTVIPRKWLKRFTSARGGWCALAVLVVFAWWPGDAAAAGEFAGSDAATAEMRATPVNLPLSPAVALETVARQGSRSPLQDTEGPAAD